MFGRTTKSVTIVLIEANNSLPHDMNNIPMGLTTETKPTDWSQNYNPYTYLWLKLQIRPTLENS